MSSDKLNDFFKDVEESEEWVDVPVSSECPRCYKQEFQKCKKGAKKDAIDIKCFRCDITHTFYYPGLWEWL